MYLLYIIMYNDYIQYHKSILICFIFIVASLFAMGDLITSNDESG